MELPDENLRPQPDEKPRKLPRLSPEQIQVIRSRLPAIREDITNFLTHFDTLRENYQEEFARVNSKHPNLARATEVVRGFMDYFGEHNEELSNEQFVQFLNEYNFYAHKINALLREMDRENLEEREQTLVEAVRGEIPFDEAEFTEAQKEELKAFAQNLWRELFPESNIDRFVKWANGQKDLEGYQKILLIPANGIEAAVMGFIDLFKIKTYEELGSAVESLGALGLKWKNWCEMVRGLKFAYEQLPTTDKIAPILSFIMAFAFLFGGAKKLIEIAKQTGQSTKAIATIKGIFGTRAFFHATAPVGKIVPLGAMLGIALPYIKED